MHNVPSRLTHDCPTPRQAPDCFAACLFSCYELIRPDVALEVAWANGLTEQARGVQPGCRLSSVT